MRRSKVPHGIDISASAKMIFLTKAFVLIWESYGHYWSAKSVLVNSSLTHHLVLFRLPQLCFFNCDLMLREVVMQHPPFPR